MLPCLRCSGERHPQQKTRGGTSRPAASEDVGRRLSLGHHVTSSRLGKTGADVRFKYRQTGGETGVPDPKLRTGRVGIARRSFRVRSTPTCPRGRAAAYPPSEATVPTRSRAVSPAARETAGIRSGAPGLCFRSGEIPHRRSGTRCRSVDSRRSRRATASSATTSPASPAGVWCRRGRSCSPRCPRRR